MRQAASAAYRAARTSAKLVPAAFAVIVMVSRLEASGDCVCPDRQGIERREAYEARQTRSAVRVRAFLKHSCRQPRSGYCARFFTDLPTDCRLWYLDSLVGKRWYRSGHTACDPARTPRTRKQPERLSLSGSLKAVGLASIVYLRPARR